MNMPKGKFLSCRKNISGNCKWAGQNHMFARLANQSTYYIYTFLPFSQIPFPFSLHLSVDFPGFFSYSPLLTGSAFSFRLLPLAVKN